MSQFNIKLFLIAGYTTSGSGALFSKMQSGFIEALNKAKQNPFDIKLDPRKFCAEISLRVEAKMFSMPILERSRYAGRSNHTTEHLTSAHSLLSTMR